SANANDGALATEITTPNSTHEPYWEVNLGQAQALYNVRVVAASGFQGDLTHATLSVFNTNHDLVLTQHLGGAADIFDLPLPGPVLAQFVRVGVEYAERTRNPSGANWFMGIKEVQAFGRATNEVGLLSLTATQTQIVSGASTTLQ